MDKSKFSRSQTKFRILSLLLNQTHLCYVYTMFPAATAAPFARNVVRRGIFGHFFLSFHVLLSFITVYHGIRDGSWGYGLLSPGGSKARYGSACGLPRMPVRSLPVRHVLIGSLTFLTF